MNRLTEILDIDGMKIKVAKERPLSNQGLGEIIHKLYKLEDIEEEIGCSLEVVFKALKEGIYCEYSKSLFNKCKLQKLKVYLVYDYGYYSLKPTHKADFLLDLYEYKKTWWLKEDRSE